MATRKALESLLSEYQSSQWYRNLWLLGSVSPDMASMQEAVASLPDGSLSQQHLSSVRQLLKGNDDREQTSATRLTFTKIAKRIKPKPAPAIKPRETNPLFAYLNRHYPWTSEYTRGIWPLDEPYRSALQSAPVFEPIWVVTEGAQSAYNRAKGFVPYVKRQVAHQGGRLAVGTKAAISSAASFVPYASKQLRYQTRRVTSSVADNATSVVHSAVEFVPYAKTTLVHQAERATAYAAGGAKVAFRSAKGLLPYAKKKITDQAERAKASLAEVDVTAGLKHVTLPPTSFLDAFFPVAVTTAFLESVDEVTSYRFSDSQKSFARLLVALGYVSAIYMDPDNSALQYATLLTLGQGAQYLDGSVKSFLSDFGQSRQKEEGFFTSFVKSSASRIASVNTSYVLPFLSIYANYSLHALLQGGAATVEDGMFFNMFWMNLMGRVSQSVVSKVTSPLSWVNPLGEHYQKTNHFISLLTSQISYLMGAHLGRDMVKNAEFTFERGGLNSKRLAAHRRFQQNRLNIRNFTPVGESEIVKLSTDERDILYDKTLCQSGDSCKSIAYKTLNLDPNKAQTISTKAIKSSYRHRMRFFHTDKCGTDICKEHASDMERAREVLLKIG